MEDDELVARMAAGDRSAFAELVRRHLDGVLAFAERMTGQRADAEDIAQDTFARAWEQAPRWRPGRAAYRTWLFQVAANRARDRWRRQRPAERIDDTRVSEQPLPEQQLEAGQRSRRVREALQALPERQRAAVILRHYHGMGNIEAAQVLGVSVEAVESLLGRARRALRRALARDMEAME